MAFRRNPEVRPREWVDAIFADGHPDAAAIQNIKGANQVKLIARRWKVSVEWRVHRVGSTPTHWKTIAL